MAKATIGFSGSNFGTAASVGNEAAPAVSVAVTFAVHTNPDGTNVKDTRK